MTTDRKDSKDSKEQADPSWWGKIGGLFQPTIVDIQIGISLDEQKIYKENVDRYIVTEDNNLVEIYDMFLYRSTVYRVGSQTGAWLLMSKEEEKTFATFIKKIQEQRNEVLKKFIIRRAELRKQHPFFDYLESINSDNNVVLSTIKAMFMPNAVVPLSMYDVSLFGTILASAVAGITVGGLVAVPAGFIALLSTKELFDRERPFKLIGGAAGLLWFLANHPIFLLGSLKWALDRTIDGGKEVARFVIGSLSGFLIFLSSIISSALLYFTIKGLKNKDKDGRKKRRRTEENQDC